MTEPRVTTIEGRRVLVVSRPRPIPSTLQVLLEGGRDATGRLWAPLRVVNRYPLRIRGARRQCMEQDHRLVLWVEGLHVGSDSVTRSLQLQACEDCGAVCVRDRSYDSLAVLTGDPRDAANGGRRPLRRKDHVIGWYTGIRRAGRLYT